MTIRLSVLVVLAVAAMGSAQAAGYDPIETRQAGQDLLAGTFNGIKALSATKGDMKTIEASAKSMARWITQFPSQFPKGSEQGHNTKALPVIWTDSAGFEKAAQELATASNKLAELAKAGDADGVAAQIKVVGDACASCHKNFRAR